MASLSAAPVCCATLAELSYAPLAAGAAVEFRFDRDAEAFAFASGKSYYKAFRLPDPGRPARVLVQSFALGDVIDRAHILYPELAQLDERFEPLAAGAPAAFELRRMGTKEAAAVTWGLPVTLEARVALDPRARYLVVRTTAALLAGSSPYVTRRATPIVVGGIVTAIPGEQDTVAIRHSPFGMLRVQLLDAGPP